MPTRHCARVRRHLTRPDAGGRGAGLKGAGIFCLALGQGRVRADSEVSISWIPFGLPEFNSL